MTATTYMLGHKIYWRTPIGVKEGWYYKDFTPIMNKRPCKRCGEMPTAEGHDKCLSNLPGVTHACCGHGIEGQGYIKFIDGRVIRGEFKVEKQVIKLNKVDPIDYILWTMDKNNLKQCDLVGILGDKSNVSKVLNRKRPLTITMIRRLSKEFGISTDTLIREYDLV